MGSAARNLQNNINQKNKAQTGPLVKKVEPGNKAIPTKPEVKKPVRSDEETEALKRSFLLGFNNYKIGKAEDKDFTKMHNHVFQGDGDYCVVNNKIGLFISKMREIERPGLSTDWGRSSVKLKVPRMPGLIYHQIVQFFSDISEDMGQAEAFIQVYFDKTTNEYVCNVPVQTVSKTSVKYEPSENLNEIDRDRYVFVFEIHSHNTMPAYFSGTDNADEKDTRFYGVLGKLDNPKIEEKFRYLVMGKEFTLTKEDIFDFSGDDAAVTKDDLIAFLGVKTGAIDQTELMKFMNKKKTYIYPKEWRGNVKKPVYATPVGGYVGGKPGTPSTPVKGYEHGENWDDYDDYINGGTGDWAWDDKTQDYIYTGDKKKDSDMTTYEDDIPLDAYPEIDIEETFNLESYEYEAQSDIIEAFISSADQIHVGMILDALVDHGHDGMIQSFCRR